MALINLLAVLTLLPVSIVARLPTRENLFPRVDIPSNANKTSTVTSASTTTLTSTSTSMPRLPPSLSDLPPSINFTGVPSQIDVPSSILIAHSSSSLRYLPLPSSNNTEETAIPTLIITATDDAPSPVGPSTATAYVGVGPPSDFPSSPASGSEASSLPISSPTTQNAASAVKRHVGFGSLIGVLVLGFLMF